MVSAGQNGAEPKWKRASVPEKEEVPICPQFSISVGVPGMEPPQIMRTA